MKLVSPFLKAIWVGAFLALLTPAARAIDPLPPDIETAPEHVKRAYIERTARASERQKLEIGRQRYEQRMGYKQALVSHLREEASARRSVIQSQIGTPAALATTDSISSVRRFNPFFVFVLVVGCVLVFWYRFVFKPKRKGV